jgi:hypothetical protein
MDQSFTQIPGEGFNIPVSCFVYTVPAFNRLDLVRVKADLMRPISRYCQIGGAKWATAIWHGLPSMTAAIAQYEKKQQKKEQTMHPKIKHGLNSRTIPSATQVR